MTEVQKKVPPIPSHIEKPILVGITLTKHCCMDTKNSPTKKKLAIFPDSGLTIYHHLKGGLDILQCESMLIHRQDI